jgi:hypothetical protein
MIMQMLLKNVFAGVIIITALFLAGCAGGGSGGGTYYQDYYDPYPNWGRGGVYVDHGRPLGSPNIGRPVHLPARSRPVRRR